VKEQQRDMTAREFIDIIEPYHSYMDVTQGEARAILHPASSTGQVVYQWYTHGGLTDVAHTCRRCEYLAVAGYEPVQRPVARAGS
jgi:hypothetical protein